MNGDEMQRALGRLEGQLQGLREAFDGFAAEQRQGRKDHERRLRSLERWRWILTGAGGLAGFIGGYVLGG